MYSPAPYYGHLQVYFESQHRRSPLLDKSLGRDDVKGALPGMKPPPTWFGMQVREWVARQVGGAVVRAWPWVVCWEAVPWVLD